MVSITVVGTRTDDAARTSRRRANQPSLLEDREDARSERSVRSTSTQASTVATTTSLASRLRTLELDYNEATRERDKLGEFMEHSILEGSESGYCSDESSRSRASILSGQHRRGALPGSDAVIESQLRFPAFQICSRLFIVKGNHPVQLKRLSIQQCEEFRSGGYTVLDGVLTRDMSAAIKTAALSQFHKGRLVEGGRAAAAAGLPPDALHMERVVRGDHIMWLSVGRPPADSAPLSQLLVALQELYDDLAQFVRLRRSVGEYQVSVHPSGSVGMGRHKDAAPDHGRGTRMQLSSCSAPLPTLPPPGSQAQAQTQAQAQAQAAGVRAGQGCEPAATSDQQGHVAGHCHNTARDAHVEGSDTRSSTQRDSGQGEGVQGMGDGKQGCTSNGHTTYAPNTNGNVNINGSANGTGNMTQPLQQATPQPPARRVTILVCCNSEWEKEHGGMVRVWPPRRAGQVRAGRSSVAGSDGGVCSESQFSEDRSDTYSLRSHYFGGTGAGGVATTGGSVTSSMWAELGAQEHETASVDNYSIADPADQNPERPGLEWVECAGGEIALDIAPLPGRVVVLLSGAVEHGVGACTVDQVHATAWLS